MRHCWKPRSSSGVCVLSKCRSLRRSFTEWHCSESKPSNSDSFEAEIDDHRSSPFTEIAPVTGTAPETGPACRDTEDWGMFCFTWEGACMRWWSNALWVWNPNQGCLSQTNVVLFEADILNQKHSYQILLYAESSEVLTLALVLDICCSLLVALTASGFEVWATENILKERDFGGKISCSNSSRNRSSCFDPLKIFE